ncbi:MAG: alpha/beta hydrolase [Actinobacteria bacterium]|nr:alpha/beta hydrolase [Actinomycetota bacterium]
MLQAYAGGRLFGTAFGPGVPRVVALHGWARTHADFTGVLGGLDADTGAIAVDLPGFGATPPPPEVWGGRQYAEAIVPLLADLPEPPVLLCHSFGGRVGVHLAAGWPDHVRALVLTGVPLLRLGGGRKPALRYRVGRALHRRGILGDEAMERLRQRYGSTDYKRAQGIMRAVHVVAVNETYEDQLAATRCPVELVWADNDTEAPLPVAERAATMLGDQATLTVLPGAGHMTPLTAPDALRAAIERQLAGQ